MTRKFFLIVGFLIVFALVGNAQADPEFGKLEFIGTTRIIEIVDGDTVIVDPPINNSNEIRLIGIQAPKLPLGRKNFTPWPLGKQSKAALSALALNQMVTLYAGGQKMDRHGRHLAHLLRDDGVWIQGRMLSTGMARVYSFPDNRALIHEMLSLQNQARKDTLGIWSHAFYDLRTPAMAAVLIGRFEIIEARVLHTAKTRKRIYLNFGEDWRTDFTASIKKTWKIFESAGLDLLLLEGKSVRVRGWLKEWNGPSITLTHPEQIEVLD